MDVAPSPSLLLFVRNTDINVLRSFSLREKSLSIPVSRANGSVFNPGSKGIFQDFCVQPNTRTNISTNIFRSAMIHGSGTSDVDLGHRRSFYFSLPSRRVEEKRRRFVGVVKSGLVKGGGIVCSCSWIGFFLPSPSA